MTVEYLAGKRIKGLSTDRTSTIVSTSTTGVSWDTSTATLVTASGNTATATGSGVGWNKTTKSTNTFTPSNAPVLQSTMSVSYHHMMGFGKGDLNSGLSSGGTSYAAIDYAMYTDKAAGGGASGDIYIYENGVGTGVVGTATSATDKQITMDSNGLVKYYVAGSLVYTSTNTASGLYYVQYAPYQVGANISPDITTNETNIQNGTVFEETDTNKSYIFDSSTGAWTQI